MIETLVCLIALYAPSGQGEAEAVAVGVESAVVTAPAADASRVLSVNAYEPFHLYEPFHFYYEPFH